MSEQLITDPTLRHDFVLLFDVTDGNPNGDPDLGNAPRSDPDSMQGLMTDGAVKRKVRDWVDIAGRGNPRNKIYIQADEALNTMHQRAYTALGITSTGTKQLKGDIDLTRAWMCENFYDIRLFGAVMTTGVNCGQVRGPMQFTFARSIDPIFPLDITITRIAVTRPKDMVVVSEDGEGKGKQGEMGRKSIVPYGLYRAYGFFSPHLAARTGVTSDDLAMFWQALQTMWEVDRSAARGMMACRGIYIFTHAASLGNAPAHKLFERVAINSTEKSPRGFADYKVAVDSTKMPQGVSLTILGQ